MNTRASRSPRKSVPLEGGSRSRTPTIQNFEVDIHIEGTSQSPEGSSVLELWTDDTTCYILVIKLHRAYRVEQNCCFRVSLLPFTDRYHLQLNGYVAGAKEAIECSTCFGYISLIKFIATQSEQKSKPNASLLETLRISLGDKAELIGAYEAEILNGDAVVLKVEHNRLAINQYKLVLGYILKGSLDQMRHDNISSHLQLNMIPGRRSCLQGGEEPKESVELSNQLDDIYNGLRLNANDVVLVYGAINSGKSTLVHHIINRYLSAVRQVSSTSSSSRSRPAPIYYLETDPGQTEFTPCGVLSLVRLTKQVVSTPGFKYVRNSQATCPSKDDIFSKVFGGTSPAGHERHYMSLIDQLWTKYVNMCQQSSRGPLVINTMGWVEELGLKLLLHIISVVRPTKIVRVFKQENETYIFNEKLHLLPSQLDTLDVLPPDVGQVQHIHQSQGLSFEFYCAPSCTLSVYKYSPFKLAKMRREINQLAYMVGNLWPKIAYHPFQRITPMSLSIPSVCLHIVDTHLRQTSAASPFALFDVLPSCWVLLGNIDEDLTHLWELDNSTTNRARNVRLLNALPSSAVCLGCGIVRAVWPNTSTIDIVTPLARQQPPSKPINLVVVPSHISMPPGLSNERLLYTNHTNYPFHQN